MDSIQRLRHQAAAAGTLWSNAQQRATTERQGIVIEPANPTVIYPPVYSPTAVYGPWPYPDYSPVDISQLEPDFDLQPSFGIGFPVGFVVVRSLWRWCTVDWRQRRVQLDVDRFNALNRHMPGIEGTTWQHDPSRLSVPSRDFTWRVPARVFRGSAMSAATIPRMNLPRAAVPVPTAAQRSAPLAFATSRASAAGPAAFRSSFIRIGRTGAAGSDRVAPTRRQQSYDAALYASVPYSAHNSENRRSPDRGGSGRRCAFRGRVSSMTSGISLTPSPCSASMSQAKCDPLCQKLAVQPLYQGAEGAITPLTLWQPRRARASPHSEEVRFAMDLYGAFPVKRLFWRRAPPILLLALKRPTVARARGLLTEAVLKHACVVPASPPTALASVSVRTALPN